MESENEKPTKLKVKMVAASRAKTASSMPKEGSHEDDVVEGDDVEMIEQGPVMVVSLGIVSGKNGQQVPSSITCTIRADSTGAALNPATLDMDKCNGALDAGLPTQYQRLNRSYFVIHCDTKGQATTQMSIVQNKSDLREG